MKCANCNEVAWYEYKLTLDKSLYFCEKDLPSFLAKAKLANLLEKTDKLKEMIEDGLQSISAPEQPSAEPTPETKTTKKAAAKDANNS
jgi:hypothetical protein